MMKCAPNAARRGSGSRVAGLALLLLVLLAAPAWAFLDSLLVPKAVPWDRWTAHDPASRIAVDHGPWMAFLSSHVTTGPDGINRIAYGRISAEERQALKDYLAALSATTVGGLERNEQRAFWINLYNALTVDVVFDHYPVTSIRDIDLSGGLFSGGPWDKKLIRVENEPLSLNDIEHRILRPIWKDPRLHYAVNCASLGCPNLIPIAFTGTNGEALLDAGAKAYVNHPRGASVTSGRLAASKIYSWFQADFGNGERGVIAHLRQYADSALAAALATVERIDEYVYDWSLNDATFAARMGAR